MSTERLRLRVATWCSVQYSKLFKISLAVSGQTPTIIIIIIIKAKTYTVLVLVLVLTITKWSILILEVLSVRLHPKTNFWRKHKKNTKCCGAFIAHRICAREVNMRNAHLWLILLAHRLQLETDSLQSLLIQCRLPARAGKFLTGWNQQHTQVGVSASSNPETAASDWA